MIIYSFKILFASFHLKNSAVSGCVFSLPVASTLLFKVNSFSGSVTLDTSLQRPSHTFVF